MPIPKMSKDGKVRTDMFYPAGFMDMVQIDKTKDAKVVFVRLLIENSRTPNTQTPFRIQLTTHIPKPKADVPQALKR